MVASDTNLVKNTTYKVVIPFYLYAAVSFLIATVLLFVSTEAFTQYHFHPRTLAITHTMALGWGTMIILGASHQLVPVLIEARLYSNFLAYLSFALAAVGIPLLLHSFFYFQFGWAAETGAVLINAAILCFLINLVASISSSKSENIHALFVVTATAWLLVTTFIGLLLVFNFTYSILPNDSLHYLSLHAHLGVAGWFLLLVIGVASRLIPMFLISKYDQPKRLWIIYWLLNAALLGFVLSFFFSVPGWMHLAPAAFILFALLLFGNYCYKTYRQRIRRQVDEQMKISLLSVAMMGLPLVFLIVLVVWLLFAAVNTRFVLAYGFSVFFGWLTAIILGMTFKTLPFIVWNKIYHSKSGSGKTPNPKDLFSTRLFNSMGITYLAGFGFFIAGVLGANSIALVTGSVLLLLAAVLYNLNLVKILLHKPLAQ